jgi:hypothetical protein
MVYTNFPNGVTSMGVPVNGMLTNGNTWFLKPGTSTPTGNGSNGNDGLTPTTAFLTTSYALTAATAGQNDIIYMIASSDTASQTTDYQSATLTWNKDLTRLVGINAGPKNSQRSRISTLSTANGANLAPLFTLSANDCYFENIEFFAGVPGSNPTQALGCMLVSGERNVFRNCQISGTGGSTMDAAGQYSLKVTGQENYFEDCTIGLDTVARASATYEMYLSGGAVRNVFRRCRIVTYASAATMTFLTVPVNGIDRWNLFEDCAFINMPTGVASGTTITQGFSITGGGTPDGCVLLKDCKLVGAGASESAASGRLFYYANGTGKMVSAAF